MKPSRPTPADDQAITATQAAERKRWQTLPAYRVLQEQSGTPLTQAAQRKRWQTSPAYRVLQEQSGTPLPLGIPSEMVADGPILPPLDSSAPQVNSFHTGFGQNFGRSRAAISAARKPGPRGRPAYVKVDYVEDGYQQRDIAAAPVEITPTIYPEDAGDGVSVENAVSIDLSSAEFQEFRDTLQRLCLAIEQSSHTSPERASKLTAELQAGLKIIEGPKPAQKLIELLLTYPLAATGTIFAGTAVAELARHAVELLLKLTDAN
jgi:hypothetical protein